MDAYRTLGVGAALWACLLTSGCEITQVKYSDGGLHARGAALPDAPAGEAATDEAAAPDAPLASEPDASEVDAEASAEPAPETAAPAPGAFPAGLVVEDLRDGDGAACESSSLVIIRYEGRVQGGPSFARTPSGEQDGPWPVSSLVPGLRDGMIGMREGGRRRIVVPPDLGYGDTPVTDEETGEVRIPAGSTLVFTVELLEVHARGTGAPTDG
jgi:peptidylprolyl isomerase